MSNEKDLIEFQVSLKAIRRQQAEMDGSKSPYLIEGLSARLMFEVKALLPRVRQPGLMFDSYHVGQAMAVRDALNDAYEAGYSRAVTQEPEEISLELSREAFTTIMRGLKSEDGENPEYDRALIEVFSDAYGYTQDQKQEVATLLGIKGEWK